MEIVAELEDVTLPVIVCVPVDVLVVVVELVGLVVVVAEPVVVNEDVIAALAVAVFVLVPERVPAGETVGVLVVEGAAVARSFITTRPS